MGNFPSRKAKGRIKEVKYVGLENRCGLNLIREEVAPLKDALSNIAAQHGREGFCMDFAGMETKALVISFVLDNQNRLPERIPVGPDLVLDIAEKDLVPAKFKSVKKTPAHVWYQYGGLIVSGIEHQMLPSK